MDDPGPPGMDIAEQPVDNPAGDSGNEENQEQPPDGQQQVKTPEQLLRELQQQQLLQQQLQQQQQQQQTRAAISAAAAARISSAARATPATSDSDFEHLGASASDLGLRDLGRPERGLRISDSDWASDSRQLST